MIELDMLPRLLILILVCFTLITAFSNLRQALAVAYVQRVDTGSTVSYTDSLGNVWAADRAYTAGSFGYTTSTTATFPTTSLIANTVDDPLYQNLRRNANPFSYQFDVPNGTYQVTLKFAEIFCTAPNCRVFSVAIEGATVLSNLDVFAIAGANTAYNQTFTTTVTDGQVTISFTTSAGSAAVNAIEVIEVSTATPTPTPKPPTSTPTPTVGVPTSTPTPTLTPTPTPAGPTPTPLPSWFEVQSGNVYSGGRITLSSPPPSPTDYDVIGGIVTHPDTADPNVRVQNDWLLANYTPTTYPYDYDYFHNRLETQPILSLSEIPAPPNGDGVYEIVGPIVISDTSAFDGRNIVLFVDGDLLLTQPNFTPVSGARIFIVRGNISFDPVVSAARAIFLANGTINTGASATNPLSLTGMLLSNGGVNLERMLGQNNPSERILYDFSIAIRLQNVLWKSPVSWSEAVP